jgi:hypothetical protein
MYTIENQGGRGEAQIFAEIPGGGGAGGGHAFWTILPAGSPILGFIAFLLTRVFFNLHGGPLFYPPPHANFTLQMNEL